MEKQAVRRAGSRFDPLVGTCENSRVDRAKNSKLERVDRGSIAKPNPALATRTKKAKTGKKKPDAPTVNGNGRVGWNWKESESVAAFMAWVRASSEKQT